MINSTYKTLISYIQEAKKIGYNTEILFLNQKFKDRDNNIYHLSELHMDAYYRFEGDSDPGDSTILCLLSYSDGSKLYISSPYGLHADIELMEILTELRKKDLDNYE